MSIRPVDSCGMNDASLTQALLRSPGMLRAGVRSTSLLRNTSVRNAQQALAGDPRTQIPRRHVAGEINCVLISEADGSAKILNDEDLLATNETFDELLDSTLSKEPNAPIEDWVSIDDQIFRPLTNDDSVASRVLRPGSLEKLPFDGKPVLFLPTPTTAIVAPANNPEAIARAAELVPHFTDAEHHLSLRPLIRWTDRWQILFLSLIHI